ncbi:MAG: putative uracil-DNA glycosylase, family 4 [Phycisphaerales bacterium]|nr:putative uracil-DNA glycosylase, family 4 [Phycisphaerales bacterium]MDB5356120.1 putative uracil-DNA glycosylase, family 4 [Phycisphaerales bacterium]
MSSWDRLQKSIVSCEKCSRLRSWCQQVAVEKRAAFRDEGYWARPIPNLGSADARLLIVGLAPAAHGGNRTGRMFTGDRSGDFLFRALYEAGFATQPTSVRRGDGLELIDLAITAVGHCAPPANKPLPEEVANCSPFMEQTVDLMPDLRGVVCLGRIAFDACVRLYRSRNWLPDGRKPEFAHGALHEFPNAPFLLCCFHPSQQNTFTGRLTPEMIRDVFSLARRKIIQAKETCPEANRSPSTPQRGRDHS